MEQSAIAEFYKERSVFVTGGTGFMGKVLVEKLLRSCSEIERIYLLMRPSKGKSVVCRLRELTDNQVYLMAFRFLINCNQSNIFLSLVKNRADI